MHDSDSAVLRGAPPIGHTDGSRIAHERQRSASMSGPTWMMGSVDPKALTTQNIPHQPGHLDRPPHISLPYDADTLSSPEISSDGSSATKVSDDCSSSSTVGQEGSESHLGEGNTTAEDDSPFGRRDKEVVPLGMSGGPLGDAIDHLVPVNMSEYERYKRAYCYPPPPGYKVGEHVIHEGCTAQSSKRKTPPNWTTCIHPEGTRYFYRSDLQCPVVTEAWLHDEELRMQIEGYMDRIFEYINKRGVDLLDRGNTQGHSHETEKDKKYFQDTAPVVLVLEVRLTGRLGYYFVDHQEQTLFWLDEMDFSFEVGEVRIKHDNFTIGSEMTSHYWKHNDYFPHLYELTDKDLVEIDDMIAFALGDSLTSETSAVNSFNLEQLKLAQEIVDRHEQRSHDRRKQAVGERRTLCRLASTLVHERFLNLHGERGARLDSKQSIHYSSDRRRKLGAVSEQEPEAENLRWHQRMLAFLFSPQQKDAGGNSNESMYPDPEPCQRTKEMQSSSFWFDAATILMFGGPYVHANRLRDITWDRIVNKNLLTKYTERMVAEWRDVALYGTVLLGANVSFLTIQSVDDAGKDSKPFSTPAQRASYFSILASLGTVVSSLVLLILVRHREVMGNKLIAGRSHSRWGLETLAVMYGTPFSLVIWSILGFFISFAILWSDRDDPVLVGIVVVSCVSFAIFLGWAVWASYSEEEPYRFLAQVATRKVKAVGKVARRGTVDFATGATRRLSSAIPAMRRGRKRSLSQGPDYTEERCASPTRIDTRSNPESLELGTRVHEQDSMV